MCAGEKAELEKTIKGTCGREVAKEPTSVPIKEQALCIGQVQRVCDSFRQVSSFQSPLLPLLSVFQLWGVHRLE